MIKTITPRDGSLYVERNYANLDNIEVIESKNKGIPVIRRAEMLGELLKVKANSIISTHL